MDGVDCLIQENSLLTFVTFTVGRKPFFADLVIPRSIRYKPIYWNYTPGNDFVPPPKS